MTLACREQGARVAVEVAATDPTVLACIFFSYPLHPPGKEVWRASGSYHLADSTTSCPQLCSRRLF